jgi:hypothetical protein
MPSNTVCYQFVKEVARVVFIFTEYALTASFDASEVCDHEILFEFHNLATIGEAVATSERAGLV